MGSPACQPSNTPPPPHPSQFRDFHPLPATSKETKKEEEKKKHLAGCVGLGRAFLPIVFTTLLGIGPQDAREYIGGLFSDLYLAERLAGGSGHDANHRRVLFMQSLQATVVRANTRMALVLSAPPPAANAPAPSAPPTPAAASSPAVAT